MNSSGKNVKKVVAAGLCTSCGGCVAICPQQTVCMRETPSGLLFAEVNEGACDGCGLCLRVCGGWHLAPGLLPQGVDPFKGKVLSAYCGYATDPKIRLRGQSGGVVTALLSFLFDSGDIEKALVSKMPEDGTLRPKPFVAKSKKDLLQTQGSKYCPVALNSVLPRNCGENGEEVAVVGLPCHLHTLRNAQLFYTNWKSGIGLTIGLFCDRTLSYVAIDYLIEKGKSATRDVEAFRYRDKTQGGWPGSIYLRTKSGEEIRIPTRERQVVKDYFTPQRCRLCFDKMNVLCDIAVGDAWGVQEDKEGHSVLIARTEAGLDLLDRAVKAGYLFLSEVDPEKIFAGQGVEVRRDNWSAFEKVTRAENKKVPDFKIDPIYKKNVTSESESFAKRESRWANVVLSGKTSRQILRAIKKQQFILKIKNKFK